MFEKILTANRPGGCFPPAVMVTGPQRSGTRIAAKMAAVDLGYCFADEREIQVGKLRQAVEVLVSGAHMGGGVVLHAPALCAESHLLWDRNLCPVRVAVVVVIRDLNEIAASCRHLKWSATGEINKYRGRPEFAPYLISGAHVAQWKYDVLQLYQRPLIRTLVGEGYYYSVGYRDLKHHDLWVPDHERVGWEWDQTERR